MDAALRVFAQKGFDRASNKDIAREAGITPGLIYYYFKSKKALLKAIFESRSPQRVACSISKEILDLPPEEFFRSAVKHFLTGVEDAKFMEMLLVYLPEAMYHPEVAPIGTDIIAVGSRFMEDYLAAKMESGELCIADPVLVTNLVMGSVMNIAMRRQVLNDPLMLKYSQDQIVEGVVSLALRGLLPS
jgi:AcrR family transcriptional regulator